MCLALSQMAMPVRKATFHAKAKFNDMKFDCLLDTGAAINVISASMASTLNLKVAVADEPLTVSTQFCQLQNAQSVYSPWLSYQGCYLPLL